MKTIKKNNTDNPDNPQEVNYEKKSTNKDLVGRKRVHHTTASVLQGNPYGKLTAIREVASTHRVFLCECECGTRKRIRLGSLVSGKAKSCGCAQHIGKEKHHIKAGDTFGRLTVIRELEERLPSYKKDGTLGATHRAWVCECSCGSNVDESGVRHLEDEWLTVVKQNSLINGNTRSCGCLKDEHMQRLVGRFQEGIEISNIPDDQ